MQSLRALATRFELLIVFCMFALFTFLRAPDILPPRFWAEDLTGFINDWELYHWGSLVRPYAGYFHAVPRITAATLSIVPLEWAVWEFTLVTLFVTGWSAAIIFRTLGRGFAGAVGALALLLAPGWTEVIGSVTNLQWIMAPALLLILINGKHLSRSERIMFAVLSGLSGPFSAIFAPLALTQIVIYTKNKSTVIDVAIVVCIAAGIQTLGVLTSGSSSANETPEVVWLFMQLTRWSQSGSVLPFVSACLLAGSCIFVKRRSLRIQLLIGILLMMVAISVKFYDQPRIFETGTVGNRYWYVQAVIWLFIPATYLNESKLPLRRWGIILLVATLSATPFLQFTRNWPWPTNNWSEFVTQARQQPTTYEYAPNWQFTLDLSGD